MSDSFITVVLILITSVVLFVIPLATVSARSDIASRQTVQAAVTEFVDTVRQTGTIKREDYDKLLQEIETTGNAYDPQINVQHLGENPTKNTLSSTSDTIKIGENIYYIDYTTQIEELFDKADDGIIRLKQGDYVKIDVVNTNETVYQMLQRSLYGISGGNIGRISGEHTGLVIESTEGKMATY